MNERPHEKLREQIPSRSNINIQGSYRKYKDVLRDDFDNRCGYCDARDRYFGGVSNAHIDHFAPRSRFPQLTDFYGNLVYSCPFCNRAKSDKWIGSNPNVPNNGIIGFVDPCCTEFDRHLVRRSSGEIIPLSELGKFMIHNLKLQLIRHQFIWKIQTLDSILDSLLGLKMKVKRSHPQYVNLIESIVNVISLQREYIGQLYDE